MNSSNGVVSLLDMLKFAAEDFWKASELLAKVATINNEFGSERIVAEWSTIDALREHFRNLELPVSLSQFDKLFSYMTSVGLELKSLPPSDERQRKADKSVADLRVRFEQFSSVIHSELEARVFFHASPHESACYDKPELFTKEVNAKFPSIQFDRVEAGNCYAMGRATACVFHLMRVMEVGVQKLGTKLGVPLTHEKNWQDILNQINAPIAKLPPKSPSTKQIAEAASNLYLVKLAWRNEVMC